MGRRSLMLVEDEAVVALEMEDVLASAGYEIATCAASVPDALQALRECRPDAAVLDVKLRGEYVFPVADELQAAAIPFLFVTGERREILPPQHRASPLLPKPCQSHVLVRAIARLFA